MIAAIVDEEGLKRLEQDARGIFDRSGAIALLANDAPQFLQHQIGASNSFTTQQTAFEFADQQRTRFWRKLAQKLPQPFDGRFSAAILGLSDSNLSV